jgi:hypothetical protein
LPEPLPQSLCPQQLPLTTVPLQQTEPEGAGQLSVVGVLPQ